MRIGFSDSRPFTGRHMAAVMVAFFATVIGVNLVMTFSALRSFPGLTVANSYVASQSYNALLAAGRAQEAAGWRMELTAPDGRLRLGLAGGEAAAGGLSVAGFASRPSAAKADRSVTFEAHGEVWLAAGEPLAPGLWEVEIAARRGDRLLFREVARLAVPETRR